MQSSDTEPQSPFPRPKKSLVDYRLPSPLPPKEEQARHLADYLGMTIPEMRAYLDSLPNR